MVLIGSVSTRQSLADLVLPSCSNSVGHFVEQLTCVLQQEEDMGVEASGEVGLVLGDLRKAATARVPQRTAHAADVDTEIVLWRHEHVCTVPGSPARGRRQ